MIPENKKKDKPMSKTHFKFMLKHFKQRDKKCPPYNKIEKTKIKEGDIVLDYGCGPGSYSIAAAEVVGNTGKVYAADIHPLAIEEVGKRAREKGLKNIETILTDCNTKLENSVIDIVLLLDIYHDLSDPESILIELYRVLKNNGWLCVDDHHFKDEEIIDKITSIGLFKFIERKDEVFNFSKV
ncbi:MAG: class I SAM-dependent methyltransferase [Candidatus Lokiarchaeota archaeon]|nr:class I SAM-dependent methyltransferase [Candidatus Lokiarchaeota archaeon]